MEYPLISEYREAILSAEDNFNELSSLRPVLDSHGDPIMSSGNFAVVFKMRDENDGKLYAVKCFIKDQEGRDESYRKIADELETVSSSYILPLRYLENELFVDSAQCDMEEFPIVVMEWVEGETLDAYLNRNLDDKYELEMLSYRFNRMAAWLLAQPFAHGDLKPDNTLVRKDGSLVLVDYDGMFVPSMKGEKAREIGSPDYRHPARSIEDFDEHIDDFSIAVIALSLKAIALNPKLKATSSDTLLLSEKDYQSPNESQLLKDIQKLTSDSELLMLLGILYISLAKNRLDSISFRLFITSKPKQPIKSNTQIIEREKIDTSFTNTDFINGIVDEYGCIYSKDGKRLLLFNNDRYVSNYSIRPGTVIICDNAFGTFDSDLEIYNIGDSLYSISLPNSITAIGNDAFSGCPNLRKINLPNSVISIGNGAFSGCSSLQEIKIASSVSTIRDSTFRGCTSLKSINIPNSVIKIEKGAFFNCKSLKSIILPNSLTQIFDDAFKGCENLININLPDSVKIIGENAFAGCRKLQNINLPKSLISIEGNPFNGCINLEIHIAPESNFKIRNQFLMSKEGTLIACLNKKIISLNIPKYVTSIANSAFIDCVELATVIIPKSVTSIGNSAFYGCTKLIAIKIPESVTYLGNQVFYGCSSLQLIRLPESTTYIGTSAFFRCKKLKAIRIPESVTFIEKFMFFGCSSLQDIKISNSVTSIGDSAFSECEELTTLNLPNSLISIGDSAFYNCKTLKYIKIPNNVKNIGESAFSYCSSLQLIKLPDVLNTIKDNTFALCSSLKQVIIPENLTQIGYRAFFGCIALEAINIPQSIGSIGEEAFKHCSLLYKYNIPGTNDLGEDAYT
ncbi:MAG: leucine-rich repeat protein [Muribaculaceae bacterium]|nr:leucine-rich repeat protein [Muribaculaceae bacterium]